MTSQDAGGGTSGLLRDLRGFAKTMFFGGKLEKEREVPVEVLFLLIGYVAKADSIVTSHEGEVFSAVMEELDLPYGGMALASAAFERGKSRQIVIADETARIRALYPAGAPELVQLLDTLVRVALSDGRLFPRERAALEEIGQALGFDIARVNQRIAALGAA
ncbi:TerB family tellurite resistance protein [Xanthomonadaceae bacterium XH05]|nr:TerB family tellurite resistance protein [Xanthomonadaceae bacterium XH05]